MTARTAGLLAMVAVVLLLAAPAWAQLSGPSQAQVQECLAEAGATLEGLPLDLTPDLPHPDQSLSDCDADGINDALEPNTSGLPSIVDPGGVQATDDLTVATQAGLVIAGGGLEELTSGPGYRGDNAPTLRENYGLAALEIRDANHSTLDAVTNPTQTIQQGLTRMVTTCAHAITGITTSLLEWAYSPDLLAPVYDHVQAIIDVLRPAVVGGWVTVVTVAGLIWVAWRILTRRAADGIGGILWMLAALAVAGWFLTTPGTYLQTATEWTTAASGHILGALAAGEPDTTGTTAAPDTATYHPPPDTTGLATGNYGQVLRRTADRMYRTLAYQPWTVMQFGSVQAGQRWGHPYLVASTITVDEVAAVRSGQTTIQELTTERTGQLQALLERIEAEDPITHAWLQGDRSGSQLGVAVLAFVAAFAAGWVITIAAFAMLFLQLLAILLVVISPVIAVMAAYPGPFGRTLVQRYLHTLLGTFLQRLVLAILLGVLVLVYGLLLAGADDVGWFATLLAIILTSTAIVVFRGHLLYLIAGGPGAGDQAGDRSRHQLLGSAAALGAGALYLRRRTRRHPPGGADEPSARGGPGDTDDDVPGGDGPGPTHDGPSPQHPPGGLSGPSDSHPGGGSAPTSVAGVRAPAVAGAAGAAGPPDARRVAATDAPDRRPGTAGGGGGTAAPDDTIQQPATPTAAAAGHHTSESHHDASRSSTAADATVHPDPPSGSTAAARVGAQPAVSGVTEIDDPVDRAAAGTAAPPAARSGRSRSTPRAGGNPHPSSPRARPAMAPEPTPADHDIPAARDLSTTDVAATRDRPLVDDIPPVHEVERDLPAGRDTEGD